MYFSFFLLHFEFCIDRAYNEELLTSPYGHPEYHHPLARRVSSVSGHSVHPAGCHRYELWDSGYRSGITRNCQRCHTTNPDLSDTPDHGGHLWIVPLRDQRSDHLRDFRNRGRVRRSELLVGPALQRHSVPDQLLFPLDRLLAGFF